VEGNRKELSRSFLAGAEEKSGQLSDQSVAGQDLEPGSTEHEPGALPSATFGTLCPVRALSHHKVTMHHVARTCLHNLMIRPRGHSVGHY
jgi:hypothetical protein